MKKLLTAFGVLALVCACDVSELQNRMDDLEDRVTSLEALCETMNVNVASLQKFVSAHEEDLFVESITELNNGFTIMLSNGKTFQIVNGEKGGKGDKGEPGEKGETGSAPSITIGVFEGVSYWKVNGEWVLSEGKKVSAVGVTPQMKIENGKWMISYDSGTTWNEVAAAYDESTAITVTQDDDAVYLTLHDGTVFSLPKVPGFKFSISEVADICIPAGETRDFPYTVTKGDESVVFTIQGEGYAAKVIPTDISSGVVRVTAPDPASEGWVLVTAVQNSTGEMKGQCMKFVRGGVSVVMDAQTVDVLGGTAKVALKTNTEYAVSIPEEAQDWISFIAPTKAFRVDTLKFNVLPNFTSLPRQATVSVIPADGDTTSFLVSQSAGDVTPEFGVSTESPVAVGYKACTATVNVTGTVLWTLELPAGLTASKMSGAGPAAITVNVPANGTSSQVSYVVKVKTTNDVVATKEYSVTINQAGAPDANDYYALFQDGQDITINGTIYNNKSCAARCLNAEALAENNFEALVANCSTAGILFIDDKTSSTITVSGRAHARFANTVIIGRYRNSQPTIDFGSIGLQILGNAVFKNVGLASSVAGYMFQNNITGASSNMNIVIEDCTVVHNNDKYGFIRDNHPTFDFETITFENSIIKFPLGLLYQILGKTSATGKQKLFKFNNCVFYVPTAKTGYIMDIHKTTATEGGNVSTPELEFLFTNNTLINIYNNPTFVFQRAKKFVFDGNVFTISPTTTYASVVNFLVTDTSIYTLQDSHLNNNYLNSTTATAAWSLSSSKGTALGLTYSGNTMIKEATGHPFTAKQDASSMYFPVDTKIVTNGAGATYSTKLWKSWE